MLLWPVLEEGGAGWPVQIGRQSEICSAKIRIFERTSVSTKCTFQKDFRIVLIVKLTICKAAPIIALLF